MDLPAVHRTFGELIKEGDTLGLKALVAKEKRYVLACQYNPLVQEAMRTLAGLAAMRGDRELVFLCGTDESPRELRAALHHTLPFPGGESDQLKVHPVDWRYLASGTEDLALDLLAVPGQGDLDLGRDLGGGFTVLASAARSGAARVVKELLIWRRGIRRCVILSLICRRMP